jgi:CRISPR-associated protein Csb2
LTEALRLAERFRAAALKRAHGASAATVLALRGRVEGQAPAEGHRHAHYLPTDEDGDHRIDHLTVWCPAGLDSDARRALDIVTLRSWAFDHPVTFVLLDELQDEPSTGPVGEGRTWRSHTPFVPTRHPKRRTGRVVDGVGDVLCLELSRRGFPMPVACIRLQAGQAHWAAFRRTRDRQPRPTTGAVGFELEFDQVVRGPLALGRNSHFGLGLFLPTGS